jgi:hypothetical protein
MNRPRHKRSVDIVDLLKEIKWDPDSGTIPAHLIAIQHIENLRWQAQTLEQLVREWQAAAMEKP